MLSLQDAIAIVQRELENLQAPEGDAFVLDLEHTIERPFGWVFFWGSALYARTGEIRHALAGNSPLIVNRETGEVVSTGTAFPVEYYLAQYEASLNG
ncbi:MAG: hypothetical protein EPN17_14100 [Methylobacter sp.]|nr:MAG: hypothetical protein EPN17_14100 [Methylobacter sp.]